MDCSNFFVVNDPLTESLIHIDKKVGTIHFTDFSTDKLFTSQIIRHIQQQIITWCKIQAIRWMAQDLPTKLSELLATHCQYACTAVIMLEHNSPPVVKSYALLGCCFLQTVNCCEFRCKLTCWPSSSPKCMVRCQCHQTHESNFLASDPGIKTVCVFSVSFNHNHFRLPRFYQNTVEHPSQKNYWNILQE